MAGTNKKTESDFIKELEALEQQKKEATEQLKAYLKSQTDKLGQIYFELKKLENPDLSIDELVVETQNKVKEVKKEIDRREHVHKPTEDLTELYKELCVIFFEYYNAFSEEVEWILRKNILNVVLFWKIYKKENIHEHNIWNSQI